MSNLWKWILGLLALAILIWLCLRSHAPDIQANLQSATHGALVEQNYGWANVLADGREITLNGVAPSLAAKEDAGRIAADIHGVRTVTNNLEVLTAISPYITQAEYDGNMLVLTGHVPDDGARASVIKEAEELFAKTKIIDKLKIGVGHSEGWRAALSRGMQNLAQLQHGMTRVDNLALTVRGHAKDLTLKNTLDTAILAPLSGNFKASSEIVAPKPKPAATPKPVVAALNCQKEFNDALSSSTILFATSSAQIDAASYALLDQRLSEARANAVVTYLVSKGIATERLAAVGYGENSPIADNASSEGRAVNRRIELQVQGL